MRSRYGSALRGSEPLTDLSAALSAGSDERACSPSRSRTLAACKAKKPECALVRQRSRTGRASEGLPIRARASAAATWTAPDLSSKRNLSADSADDAFSLNMAQPCAAQIGRASCRERGE